MGKAQVLQATAFRLLNRPARALLEKAGKNVRLLNDWWTFLAEAAECLDYENVNSIVSKIEQLL